MKYLSYLGELFYGIHKDFNGNLHWLKKTARVAFLYGNASLEDLRASEVIILGSGEHSFWCTVLLEKCGIRVSAYCENDMQLWGKEYFGKKIEPIFDYLDRKDIHIVYAPDIEAFESVTDQFLHHGLENYSFFFHADTAVDFKDPDLRGPVLGALNCLINNNYPPEIHKNSPMGIVTRLMPGLEWWSQALYLLRDDMKQTRDDIKVLDIGPGFGFFSAILKQMKPESEIHWLSLALEDSEGTGYIDPGTRRYPIIQKYGMIEDPDYMIGEKYDRIIMTEVFEHFGLYPVTTLKKIGEALSEGGRIYMTTPNWERQNMYASWRELPEFDGDRASYFKRNKSRIDWMDLNMMHSYIYTEAELREVIALSGLAVEHFVINDCNNFNMILKKGK